MILRIKFNLLRVTHSREYILTSLKKKPRRIGHVSLYIQAVYVIPKQGNDCSKSDNFSETSVCSPDPSGRFNLQKANCDHKLPSYTCITPGAVERTKLPDIFIQKEKNIAKRNKWANERRLAQNW